MSRYWKIWPSQQRAAQQTKVRIFGAVSKKLAVTHNVMKNLTGNWLPFLSGGGVVDDVEIWIVPE